MSVVTIQNRLRIYEGNVILVPGCEPSSTVTYISDIWSTRKDIVTLYNKFDTICPASYISLHRALEVLVGSYVENTPDNMYRFIVLPEGPPPSNICPCEGITDWYAVMRYYADVPNKSESNNHADDLSKLCSGFAPKACGNGGNNQYGGIEISGNTQYMGIK